jgi:hypothetical protein
MFEDKVVIVDEAHNLLKYLRSSSRDKIIAAFRKAKRVILMTGTPILRFRSDLTLLLNLLETDLIRKNVSGALKVDESGNPLIRKAPFYTDNDSVFDEAYYVRPMVGTAQRLGRFFFERTSTKATTTIATTLATLAMNSAPAQFFTNYLTSQFGAISAAFYEFAQYVGLPDATPILLLAGLIGLLKGLFGVYFDKDGYFPNFSDLMNSIYGTTLKEVWKGPVDKVRQALRLEVDVRELNPAFETLVKDKTSFYDYEKIDSEKLKYPTVVYNPISIQYTVEQINILSSLVAKDKRIISLEKIYQRIPLAQGEDPVENLADFVTFGLKLGNLCERTYKLNPLPFVKDPFKANLSTERKQETALNYIDRDLCAYGIYPPSRLDPEGDCLAKYVLRGFTPKDGPIDKMPIHVCAKFKAMYAVLRSIRRNDNEEFSALITKREENPKDRKDIKDELCRKMDQTSVLAYYETLQRTFTNEYNQATSKFMKTKKRNQLTFVNSSITALQVDTRTKAADVIRDPTRTYLPLVWSNFEDSFEAFGAYLTSLGETYIVVHVDDTPEQRLMEKICWDRSYPVCDSPFVADPDPKSTILYRRPICVLLHPKVIEGLNFAFSPALLAMETVKGFGIKQQVYARILRGFKESNEALSNLLRPRVRKLIYEFQGDYFSSHDVKIDDEKEPYTLVPNIRVVQKLISSLKTNYYNLRYTAYNFLLVFVNESIFTRTSNDAASPEEIQKFWNTKTQAVQERISALYSGKPDDDILLGQKCKCQSECEFCNRSYLGPNEGETYCRSRNNPENRSLCRNLPLEKASTCEA